VAQSTREAIGKHPALSIAMSLVETGHMVNNTHTPHLAANSLQHTVTEVIPITEVLERAETPGERI